MQGLGWLATRLPEVACTPWRCTDCGALVPGNRPAGPNRGDPHALQGHRATINVGALWALIKIYMFYYFGGSETPSKDLPGARNRPLGPGNEVPEQNQKK